MKIEDASLLSIRISIPVLLLLLTIAGSPADSAPSEIPKPKVQGTYQNFCGVQSAEKISKGPKEKFSMKSLELHLNLPMKTVSDANIRKHAVYQACPNVKRISIYKPKQNFTKSLKSVKTHQNFMKLTHKMLKQFYDDQICILEAGLKTLLKRPWNSHRKDANNAHRTDFINNLKNEASQILCEIETSLNNTLKKTNPTKTKCPVLLKYPGKTAKPLIFEDICRYDLGFYMGYESFLKNWQKNVIQLNRMNRRYRRKTKNTMKSTKKIPADANKPINNKGKHQKLHKH